MLYLVLFPTSYGCSDGEPYTIHFFLGPVYGEPSLYGKHPNHIDIFHTFSSPLATVLTGGLSLERQESTVPKCKNCAQQKADGVLSRGQIILTNALSRDATDANNSELNSLEPAEVNRYLKEHLNWRAVYVSFFLSYPPLLLPSPFIFNFYCPRFSKKKKNPLGVSFALGRNLCITITTDAVFISSPSKESW